MTEEKEEKKLLQWHAAFFADIQIELAEKAQYLEFENEHMLSTKPMQLDVLIIKKVSMIFSRCTDMLVFTRRIHRELTKSKRTR